MLTFNTGGGSYPVLMQKLSAQSLLPCLGGRAACIVTDSNLAPLHGQRLASELGIPLISVPAGEASKDFEQAASLCSQLAGLGIGRSGVIIALGGGVIGDLAGFAASIYLRGIGYIQAPATLLAQIDSSMGGKTGINLPGGKNLVGTFHQPEAVFIDPSLLDSLPGADFTDGLAEMIKYGFIHDRTILEDMAGFANISALKENLEPLILKCCTIKKNVVEEDEFDTGLRMTLNFGHTLGHAIEKRHGLSHGRSVALGMVMISRLGVQKGLVNAETLGLLVELLQKYNLPTDASPYPMEGLLPFIAADKKNIGGSLHLILCPEAGKSIIYPASLAFFEES